LADGNEVPHRRNRTTPLWILAGLGIFLVLCFSWVGYDYITYHERIHRGISIAGVDVGGMTEMEAVAVVGAAVQEARSNSITLVGDGFSWTVLPADLGSTMDVAGAVKQAMALTLHDDFLTDSTVRIELYFRPRTVPLRGTVDELLVEELLTRIDSAFEGRRVDAAALVSRLNKSLLTLRSVALEVPVLPLSPPLPSADDQAAPE
jgi:hypothetical protein